MTIYLPEELADLAAITDPCPETCCCDPAACDDNTESGFCSDLCAVCVNGCPADGCSFTVLGWSLSYAAHRPDVQAAARPSSPTTTKEA